MRTRFSEDDRVGSSIFSLVPVNLLKLQSSLQDIASQLKFREEDTVAQSCHLLATITFRLQQFFFLAMHFTISNPYRF